ncbi:MAG: Wzz/FepE/Etk N-terminal domain-containing protein [Bacteroidota bacterium]|nr:Wzz/FepE/Etk N-terminal domain-containing protein [Bacteroidota bacterium]
MSPQSENTSPSKPTSTDEIDLIEVFKKIWAGRKTIYISVAISFVVGIIIILGTPKEYKSETTLLSEISSKSGGMGQLSGLASLAGINLNGASGGGSITVDLYPDIVKSTPFLLEVMNQKVTESKTNKTITVANYFENYTKPSLISTIFGYTIGLPGKIIGAFKNDKNPNNLLPAKTKGPLCLTEKQAQIAGVLANCIKVKTEEGTSSTSNTLTVSVETQDPLASALLTDSVIASLKKYIIDYQTGKAKKDLEFITARYNEARDKYFGLQQALASHRDQNLNVILASVNTSTERLQTEVNLAASIYNTMAQQLEQAKLKVQEQTPVFTVIEPAEMPLMNSKPKAALILAVMILLGVSIGSGIIIIERNLLLNANQNDVSDNKKINQL